MSTTTTQNTRAVTVSKLRLDESLYDLLAERAAKKGVQVETEIANHLRRTQMYTASTPVYLDDDARNALMQIAGRAITTPAELLAWATRVASLKIGEVEIELGERLATRLDTRRFGKDWITFLKQAVTEALEEKVGMR